MRPGCAVLFTGSYGRPRYKAPSFSNCCVAGMVFVSAILIDLRDVAAERQSLESGAMWKLVTTLSLIAGLVLLAAPALAATGIASKLQLRGHLPELGERPAMRVFQ